ncbi:unnamed protein product [Menidia menidia]|uniref:(Atlantic silverside) hypothetical protein n=1 Tax=Menidia menidia TaxID=238744 RepID=A0A8S4B5G4_9TELE|nr:unnamed protein product [Menidia menidia]
MRRRSDAPPPGPRRRRGLVSSVVEHTLERLRVLLRPQLLAKSVTVGWFPAHHQTDGCLSSTKPERIMECAVGGDVGFDSGFVQFSEKLTGRRKREHRTSAVSCYADGKMSFSNKKPQRELKRYMWEIMEVIQEMRLCLSLRNSSIVTASMFVCKHLMPCKYHNGPLRPDMALAINKTFSEESPKPFGPASPHSTKDAFDAIQNYFHLSSVSPSHVYELSIHSPRIVALVCQT